MHGNNCFVQCCCQIQLKSQIIWASYGYMAKTALYLALKLVTSSISRISNGPADIEENIDIPLLFLRLIALWPADGGGG